MNEPIFLFNLPFSPMKQSEVRVHLERILADGGGKRVYTPNAQILWQARRDPSLLATLLCADLLLPDGAGVLLISRLMGTPLPERITGIDTAEYLLRCGAKQGLSFFFLGGHIGVAEEAAKAWQKCLASLKVVGTHHGYFSREPNGQKKLLHTIQAAKPDILFVCLGFPEQERWINRHAAALPSVRLFMGLGGSFDVWAGRVPRAPFFCQKMGIEWLFRAVCEPKRFRKLWMLPACLCASLKDRIIR